MRGLKSIQWKLVLVYILLVVFALELFGVYMLSSIENYFTGNMQEGLHNQVQLLVSLSERYYSPPDAEGLQQLIGEFSNLIGRDMYFLDKYGVVMASSPGLEEMLGKRIVQQEVVSAMQGVATDSVRYDPTSGHRVYYYAHPIHSSGGLAGAVYASASLQLIDASLNHLRTILLTGAALTLVLSAILGLSLSRAITRPLEIITRQAANMKSGDFQQTIDVHSQDEIGHLGETFNDLAAQLQHSWDELVQEKDKVEGILTNLSDGLIVFEHSGVVMHINSTACNWFGKNKQTMLAQGSFADFPELGNEKGIIYLDGNFGLVLHQQRLPFLQAGKKQGTIVVLSDITEQYRLDQMRQEFVANVSHELRTPLTTIKTYLETLLENPDEDEEIRTRFLWVINSEAERMVRMIEDLLILSRNENRTREFKLVSIGDIIRDIVCGVEVQVANKGLSLGVRIPRDLPLVIGDADMLHRLYLNIVDNAISYTNTGEISISVYSRNKCVEVTIGDTGIGIPADSLGRIFDRFYRVDKARSRTAGGTGLGLSIAKQIAEAHGGTVYVISREGHGTEVTIPLPAAPEDAKAVVATKGGRRNGQV